MSRYADIVLPLAQPAYCFSVPEDAEGKIGVGDAVAVQFGPRNIYTGIVWRLHDNRPDVKRIKPIGRRLYDCPLLDAKQMQMWEWMAEYYMCTLGEVMRIALPSLIKPQGASAEEFSEDEFRPRTEAYIALAEEWQNEERLRSEMERIRRRAPRRVQVLEQILSFDASRLNAEGEIPRRLMECDSAQITALRKAGYITVNQRERTIERAENIQFVTPTLTPAQQQVVEQIHTSQREGRSVHLLHGITG